jgi:hypothetical protein
VTGFRLAPAPKLVLLGPNALGDGVSRKLGESGENPPLSDED